MRAAEACAGCAWGQGPPARCHETFQVVCLCFWHLHAVSHSRCLCQAAGAQGAADQPPLPGWLQSHDAGCYCYYAGWNCCQPRRWYSEVGLAPWGTGARTLQTRRRLTARADDPHTLPGHTAVGAQRVQDSWTLFGLSVNSGAGCKLWVLQMHAQRLAAHTQRTHRNGLANAAQYSTLLSTHGMVQHLLHCIVHTARQSCALPLITHAWPHPRSAAFGGN
jgi:hypothetical protein